MTQAMTPAPDFWSRRKAAVLAEAETPDQPPQPAFDKMSDAEILTELDLPDPDHLIAGDDIRGFMARAVPERLKRRALRQLWSLNPALANLDGLIDYGDDFTDAAVVLPDMKTAYQVGRGMLAHVQALADAAERAAHPVDVAVAALPADAEDAPETPDVIAPVKIADALPPTMDDAMEPATPAPRRMRFAFKD
jgi:hypothetical protein